MTIDYAPRFRLLRPILKTLIEKFSRIYGF